MIRLLCTYFFVCAVIYSSHSVSTKMNFNEDEDGTTIVSNSTKSDEEDVEVKHTIVVSTKLKNTNRRGLHNSGNGDTGTMINVNKQKDDSGEVPVIHGYKAIETTAIRTPDSRFKIPARPESVFVNRNVRDEFDVYPNYVTNPSQWKPSAFYNNINWFTPDIGREFSRPAYQTPGKFHRRISDDSMKEFYCRKCRDFNDGQIYKGCVQQRSNSPRFLYETTTPKLKIDGKLAKLN